MDAGSRAHVDPMGIATRALAMWSLFFVFPRRSQGFQGPASSFAFRIFARLGFSAFGYRVWFPASFDAMLSSKSSIVFFLRELEKNNMVNGKGAASLSMVVFFPPQSRRRVEGGEK